MNDSTWDTASIITTSSADECQTPTTMSEPIDIKDDALSILTIQSVEHHPKAGKQFMIREKQKPHRIITLSFGDLVLMDEQLPAHGWLWKCVKQFGWYGFQNVVSGTYLGHNDKKKIRATMGHHQPWEYFMTERHEDGGYVLLTIHDKELWQVAISNDGKSLVEKKAEEGAGTAWDFVEII